MTIFWRFVPENAYFIGFYRFGQNDVLARKSGPNLPIPALDPPPPAPDFQKCPPRDALDAEIVLLYVS